MAFDRERAERSVVELLWEPGGGRAVGMGFRLLDGLVATSCRCLPCAGGRIRLPDPEDPPGAPLCLQVRVPRTGAVAVGAVVAADPCADFALLAEPPGRPGGGAFAALLAGLARLPLEVTPGPERPALVFTSERRWLDGTVAGATFTPRLPSLRLPPPTTGAPVFGLDGRVVGLVGRADVRQPGAALCVLADRLPGWALRQARAAERAGNPETRRAPW